MLDFSKDKSNCMGCSACFSICPAKCITMKRDEEGFLYPSVKKDLCLSCGLCEKVCPISVGYKGYRDFDISYAFKTESYEVWKKSSSGGAFTEICKLVNPESYIFGAEWNGITVRHNYIKGIENIDIFRKSKYIESDLNGMYIKAKELLLRGEHVVFSGLPCQIAGLRNYLKKDYDNLLTIDLICHGVGSPSVFEKCLEIISTDLVFKTFRYEFRAKRKFYETEYISCLENSKRKRKYLVKDRYMELFLNQLCLRPSCGGTCHFRSEYRPGDITIADFKGLDKVFPELMGTKFNYSAIIPNSSKGMEKVMQMTDIGKYKCDLSEIKKYNPLFYKQTWRQEYRNTFFEEYINSEIETIKKWTTSSNFKCIDIKDYIYQSLPVPIRKILITRKKRKSNERKK